jgi:hypothetical protein
MLLQLTLLPLQLGTFSCGSGYPNSAADAAAEAANRAYVSAQCQQMVPVPAFLYQHSMYQHMVARQRHINGKHGTQDCVNKFEKQRQHAEAVFCEHSPASDAGGTRLLAAMKGDSGVACCWWPSRAAGGAWEAALNRENAPLPPDCPGFRPEVSENALLAAAAEVSRATPPLCSCWAAKCARSGAGCAALTGRSAAFTTGRGAAAPPRTGLGLNSPRGALAERGVCTLGGGERAGFAAGGAGPAACMRGLGVWPVAIGGSGLRLPVLTALTAAEVSRGDATVAPVCTTRCCRVCC